MLPTLSPALVPRGYREFGLFLAIEKHICDDSSRIVNHEDLILPRP